MQAVIGLSELKTLVGATKDFISSSNHRPIYQYIRLEFNATESKATAAAVDGYRLSTESAVCSADEDFVAYIKPNLPKGYKDSQAMIEMSDGYAYITTEGNVTGYRQPDGEFLNYQKAIPTSTPAYRIGFNGSYLLDALKAAKKSNGNSFCEPVVLEFRKPNDAIILRTDKENIKMILPIRIKDNPNEQA